VHLNQLMSIKNNWKKIKNYN